MKPIYSFIIYANLILLSFSCSYIDTIEDPQIIVQISDSTFEGRVLRKGEQVVFHITSFSFDKTFDAYCGVFSNAFIDNTEVKPDLSSDGEVTQTITINTSELAVGEHVLKVISTDCAEQSSSKLYHFSIIESSVPTGSITGFKITSSEYVDILNIQVHFASTDKPVKSIKVIANNIDQYTINDINKMEGDTVVQVYFHPEDNKGIHNFKAYITDGDIGSYSDSISYHYNPTEFTTRTINQDEIWTKDNNPYYLRGTITVDGAKLSIEPGVILKFAEGASLVVSSTAKSAIEAIGTADDKIVFTNTNHGQGNVYVNAPSLFKYCVWENGGVFFDNNASATFENCRIQYLDLKGESYFDTFNNNTLVGDLNINIKKTGSIGSNNTFTNVTLFGNTIDQPTTLKKINCPYLISEAIDVTSALSIEAGVQIKFYSNGLLRFNGQNAKLEAIGSVSDSIVFTIAWENLSDVYWMGFEFYDVSTSHLNYCKIIKAGTDDLFIYERKKAAIYIENVPEGILFIENCEIAYSQTAAIRTKNAFPNISNNFLHDNAQDIVTE